MTIDEICEKYKIENYTINGDVVDVDDDVDLKLEYERLDSLPLKFGKVSGSFDCNGNGLIDLKGSPSEVVGNFRCKQNNLTTLYGGPTKVGGGYDCSDNKLTDLKFSPTFVGVGFNCSWNEIKSLEGFDCELKGEAEWLGSKLVTTFMCHGNPIGSIFEGGDQEFLNFFKKIKAVKDDKINTKRLRYVMELFDKPVRLEQIKKHYTII